MEEMSILSYTVNNKAQKSSRGMILLHWAVVQVKRSLANATLTSKSNSTRLTASCIYCIPKKQHFILKTGMQLVEFLHVCKKLRKDP